MIYLLKFSLESIHFAAFFNVLNLFKDKATVKKYEAQN